MKDLKDFDISFIGIKDGMHQFEYEIDNKFFDFFNYDEFYNSKVKVVLSFLKKPTIRSPIPKYRKDSSSFFVCPAIYSR